MSQPAKVQEPSMEEILASIRRIIADDEAKPPVAERPAGIAAAPAPAPAAAPAKPAPVAAAAKPAVISDIPPSKIAAAAPRPAATAPLPPLPTPVPTEPNNQDDIDALLSGLDETTTVDEIRASHDDVEVLELTDDMAVVSASPPTSYQKLDPRDDLQFAEAAAPRTVNRASAYDSPSFAIQAPPPSAQDILSQSTVSAVESAFNTLAHTVLSSNARTLEDLVKEMLRPMLKSWLDDNLPGLVERIVKAEIERVSRSGR
jgi:uncharacterized protein